MAFRIPSQPLYSALNFLATLHLLIICSPSIATTYDLIHRDSPLSPFYNPSSTHFDRLHDAFQRSLRRVNHLKSVSPRASINPGGGEYLMKMHLGTPPVEVIGIVDTGSHLSWTQCLPCIACYKQTIPLFDPSHSSSYKNISVGTSLCNALQGPVSDDNTSACVYDFSYGDGSHSSGILVYETITLGTGNNSLSIPNIAYGCAHNTFGIFDESGSGIIGLSTSKLSLVSQLGPSYGQKFSYCLVPTSINSTSKISFGNDSIVNGSGTVTTPILNTENLYYLKLEAISVGTQKIEFPRNPIQGNIVIDSGTTLTLVPSHVFNDLVTALDKVIRLEKVADPNGTLGVCYKKNSVGENRIRLPYITLHFKGGDVKLKPVNTFSWVRNDVLCFTVGANDQLAIYGNLAQANFEIGYDLDAGTVSFKPTDCAKEHL